MTNKKTRIAKGLGASALAVATLASGLSFGASAAMATAAPADAAGAKDDQLVATAQGEYRKFYGKFENVHKPREKAQWYSVNSRSPRDNLTYLTEQPSEGDAAARTDRFSELSENEWRLLRGEGGRCFLIGTSVRLAPCKESSTDKAYWWKIDEDGRIVNAAYPDSPMSGHVDYDGPAGYRHIEVGGGSTPDFGNGDWLPQAKLDGAVSFASSVDARATVSGTTEANGRVEVRRGSAVVGSGTADASGNYSISIDAPNKGGDDKLTVALVVDGADKKTIEVTAAYGAGVEITDPTNEQNVSGQYTVRGTAQAGASVTLQMNGGEARPVTVSANGQWSQEVTLPTGERTITATQKSKGANTTTSSVTVNPGETEVELTAAGRFDASDATKPATAFGAAPTGSTVVLRNSVGQEIGRTVAKGDAYEIAIDPTKVTSGVNSFSVIIEGAAGDAKSFTLNYGQPAADVVVTKPAKNGTVAPGVVEFAGTGQAGSKIVVRGSVREVATATVGANGAWSAANPAGMPLSNGKYDLYFDQIGKGGLKSTVRHAFTIGETAPIVSPHTVTSPAAGAVVETLTPEFRGAGHEGATITVRGSSRVVATGTVQNGQWVAKVNADAPLAPGSYNLYVDQSIRGTVVGTIRAEFTVSNEAFRQLTLSAPAQGENVTTVRPTFVGTATPGAEIRVGSSRTTVATATVGADGTWRAEALFDLAKGGSYTGLEVKQTTKSGKTSTVSSTFTVDRNAQ